MSPEGSGIVFHAIPGPVRARMAHLEAVDARDRVDGTPLSHRSRQVTPQTGRFVALMAASAPAGRWVEVGTSAGYSALWIALAARAVGRRLETYRACYEAVVPNLVAGGLLLADNVTSHREELAALVDRAAADPRVDALVVPVGKGVLVCRKA
jgi:caffeoyl-CoA O-methyltransferase